MNRKLLTLFLIAALNGFARAQTPPVDDQSMTQTDVSDTDSSSTQPAVDETEIAPTQTSGGVPTTQSTRSTTRPSHRHYRHANLRPGAQGALVAPAAQPRQITADYSVVLKRSIFIKGDENTPDDSGFARPTGSAAAPEHSLVFNGVTRGDNAVAMVENTETHELLKLRVGDPISRGRVVAITLNNLDYEVDGHITRVSFGETLSGGAPEGENATATPAAPGTTQPSNTSVTRQLGESIEAYLRRRHAMGL